MNMPPAYVGGLLKGIVMNYAGVIVEDRFGHEIISCAPTSMGGVTAAFIDETDGLDDVFKQVLKLYPSLKELAAEAYCHSVIVGGAHVLSIYATGVASHC